MKNVTESTEEDQKHNNTTKMYQTVNQFKKELKQDDPLSPILFNLALQKVKQSIKMAPRGIEIGNEQLNILA